MKKIDPAFKLRYATGLGDIITCVLHSRYIGYVTFFFTKKDKPCAKCSQRAFALNVLFPIPIWKFFFKTVNEREEYLKQDLINYGYIFYDKDTRVEKQNTFNHEEVVSSQDIPILNPVKIDYLEYDGFSLLEKKIIDNDEIKTVTLVYKKTNNEN